MPLSSQGQGSIIENRQGSAEKDNPREKSGISLSFADFEKKGQTKTFGLQENVNSTKGLPPLIRPEKVCVFSPLQYSIILWIECGRWLDLCLRDS